jgi:hypothetical protein
MSELRPYSLAQSAPLTSGARFIRGFKRVGMVLGAFALGTGIVISVVVANQEQQTAFNRHAQAVCFLDVQHRGRVVMSEYRPLEVDLRASGCPGPMYTETVPNILDVASKKAAPLEGFIGPLYVGSLLSLGVGISVFAIFWIMGWLCAGFTRD